MKHSVWFLSLAVAALSACSPNEGYCKKQYECQEELGLSLEDDFAEVCQAGLDGLDNALRASAEPECAELANAQAVLRTCQMALSCEDLKKLEGGDDTLCKDQKKAVEEAQKDARDDDGSFKCDGIEANDDGSSG
jgi:hypothetical protein